MMTWLPTWSTTTPGYQSLPPRHWPSTQAPTGWADAAAATKESAATAPSRKIPFIIPPFPALPWSGQEILPPNAPPPKRKPTADALRSRPGGVGREVDWDLANRIIAAREAS